MLPYWIDSSDFIKQLAEIFFLRWLFYPSLRELIYNRFLHICVCVRVHVCVFERGRVCVSHTWNLSRTLCRDQKFCENWRSVKSGMRRLWLLSRSWCVLSLDAPSRRAPISHFDHVVRVCGCPYFSACLQLLLILVSTATGAVLCACKCNCLVRRGSHERSCEKETKLSAPLMLLRCSFAAASFKDREIFLAADSSS